MQDFTRSLEVVGRTHPGMVRNNNEDSIATDGPSGIVVLADGMGGYNSGEVASGIATNLLASGLRDDLLRAPAHELDPVSGKLNVERVIRDHIEQVNGAIYNTAQAQPQCAGMGTTLVVVVFYDNRMMVAHIGDSRLYRVRDGVFEQVTRDHSLLQEMIDAGTLSKDEAQNHPHKNLVTRALGIDELVEPEVHEYAVLPGDIYLLCSDGLNDMVTDADIGEAALMMAGNLPMAADQLIQMACDNGGRDNVSVILAKVLTPFPAYVSFWGRVKRWFGKS